MAWSKPANMGEWLKIVQRHRKKFFFPAILTMIVVIIASHWYPREYRSEAIFERRTDLAVDQMGQGTINSTLRPVRQTVQGDVKGRVMISQLIDDLITADPYVGRVWQFPHTTDGELTQEGRFMKNDLIDHVRDRLRVYAMVRSDQVDLYSVSYIDPDRQLAPRVVNRLVENYIKQTRDRLNGWLLNAQKFYKQEVDRYAAQVQDLERQKLRFELDHPGLAPDDPSSIQAKLVDLKSTRDTTVREFQRMVQKRNSLAEWVKNQPDMIEKKSEVKNPELDAVQAQLNGLMQQYEHNIIQRKMTERHPDMIRLMRQIEFTRQRLAGVSDEKVEVSSELEPNVQKISAQQELEELSGELLAMERQREELNSQVERYELMNRNFFPVRNEYLKIEAALKDSQEQLKFWHDNLRKTTIALTAEVGQRGIRLSFRQHAPEISRPSEPTLVKIAGVAIMLGLAVGAGLVLMSELLDRSFHSVEQAVDELKLPVLGAVNEIVTPGRAFRKKLMSWGVYPTLSAVMVIILLASFGTAYLSLSAPHKFDKLKKNPVTFLEDTLLGR